MFFCWRKKTNLSPVVGRTTEMLGIKMKWITRIVAILFASCTGLALILYTIQLYFWGGREILSWKAPLIWIAYLPKWFWLMSIQVWFIAIPYWTGAIFLVIHRLLRVRETRLFKRRETGNCQPAGGAYVSPAAGDPSAHP